MWTLARIFVGLLLAYAGFSKLMEPSANFEATLLKYGIFSPGWIPWMARVIPWFEWFLGSFFVLGYAPRVTAFGVGLILLGFLVTLGSSRLFLEAGGTDCGCFGQGGLNLSLRQIFFVDLASLAVSLRVFFLREFPWTLHSFLLKQGAKRDDK